jgi:hypothetical protein
MQEVEERTTTQELLYRQNEELWEYTQKLLESNKCNAVLMKTQVRSLLALVFIFYTDHCTSCIYAFTIITLLASGAWLVWI